MRADSLERDEGPEETQDAGIRVRVPRELSTDHGEYEPQHDKGTWHLLSCFLAISLLQHRNSHILSKTNFLLCKQNCIISIN